MSDPYRSPPRTPEGASRPHEIVYVARERDVASAFHRMWIRTLLFAPAGAVLACVAGLWDFAWVPVVGVLAWSIGSWRRTRGGSAVALRVDHGELTATTDHGRRTLLALPLRSLLDVTLDTKAITPVVRNTGTETMGLTSTVQGSIDISRVVLVPMAPREPVALSDDHVAHMDAVEAAGKIRSFLRAHGWLPQDEREELGI